MNRYRAHAGYPSSRLVLLLAATFVLALSGTAGSAEQRSNAPPISNRYLLLVETSKSMQHRTEGTLKEIEDLLVSGMRGQLHSNDTIGLWTFNRTLSTGKFPLRLWTGSNEKPITTAVLGFLSTQKYEKQPDFAQVFPTLSEVIKNSDYITIVLFSSGESFIHGTPVDDKVNKYFKDWRDEQKKAQMPFVTVLQATKGHITDFSVNSAPWPVELPPLPTELKIARAPKPAPPPPQPKPAAPVPPLIVTGKKSPPPGALYFSGTNPVPTSTPSIAPPQTTSALDTNQASSQPNPEHLASKPAPAETPSNISSEGHQVSAQTVIQAQPPTQLVSQSAMSVPPSQPQPPPVVSSGQSSSDAIVPEPPPATPGPAPAETATALPSSSGLIRVLIWFLALGVAFIGGGIFFLRRRSQATPHGSLITRSADRDQPKP